MYKVYNTGTNEDMYRKYNIYVFFASFYWDTTFAAAAVVSNMPYESLNPHTSPLSRLIFMETKNASHYDVYPCKV